MTFGKWLGFFLVLISLAILWQIRQLLLLVFCAVILATALNRLIRQLQKLGCQKRSTALAITIAIVIAVSLLFFLLVVPPFVEQFNKLLELLPKAFTQLRLQIIKVQFSPLAPLVPTWDNIIEQLQPLTTALFQNFVSFFAVSAAIILQILFVFLLTIMMLSNPESYRQSSLKLLPSFYRRRADEIISECEVALGNWLGAMAIDSLFVGVMSGIGLGLLQIDLVLVHALLAGLLNFIPNIGPLASVIFPMMIAVLDAPWKIYAVFILYIAIQNLESYWLAPMLMAQQVSLLPAITLTAQIFFARAFGVLGLLLALPLTVVAKTWLEEALFKDGLDRWDKS